MRHRTALLLLLTIVSTGAYSKDYNIVNYGAVADTTQLSTAAINKAIAACSANGGGRVIVPAGNFVSGTVQLLDNVELHLEAGATLYASRQEQDFPRLPQARARSMKDPNGWFAFLYAANAKNISITGNGIIDGRGHNKRRYLPDNGYDDAQGRPRNILFISCSRIKVSGINLLNSAVWNQHYLDCEDVLIEGINVYNHCNGNNDGMDIDGCRRVIVSNCVINSDDDAICLKSTGDAPCEDIIVRGCILSSYCHALKCGTESIGGFRNILFTDCIIRPSGFFKHLTTPESGRSAVCLLIEDGGFMEGVTASNLVVYGTQCPIYVRLVHRGRSYSGGTGKKQMGSIRNIHFSNIKAYHTGNLCSSISSLPSGKVENVTMDNLTFVNVGGLQAGNYMTPTNDRKQVDKTKYLEHDEDIADAGMSDNGRYRDNLDWAEFWGNLPCYGLFMRNVHNVSISNSQFSSEGEEPRAGIIAVNTTELDIANTNLPPNKILVKEESQFK